MKGIFVDKNIQLKRLEKHHATELFDLVDANRDILSQWLPWVELTYSYVDSLAFIELAHKQMTEKNEIQMGIWFEEKLCGCIGMHSLNWSSKSTCPGHWLAAGVQGKGIITKATRAFVNYAFNDYSLNRVEIRCGTNNLKSRAIPEKLGFTLEGTLREAEYMVNGSYIDLAVYGMIQSDWK